MCTNVLISYKRHWYCVWKVCVREKTYHGINSLSYTLTTFGQTIYFLPTRKRWTRRLTPYTQAVVVLKKGLHCYLAECFAFEVLRNWIESFYLRRFAVCKLFYLFDCFSSNWGLQAFKAWNESRSLCQPLNVSLYLCKPVRIGGFFFLKRARLVQGRWEVRSLAHAL